jgi:cytochrome c oxidase subunit IV
MAAHIGSLRVYLGVFTVLMVGTVVTFLAAKMDLGLANAPVALVIATVKAVFVVLFFMHVKDSDRLTKITVAAGIFWLGILLTLTMTDFLSRTWY